MQLTIAVAEGRRPEVPPPSQLPGGGGSFEGLGPYIALMRACWSQDPAARPDFNHIAAALGWVKLRHAWAAAAMMCRVKEMLCMCCGGL